jgi:hypothetical protein
VIRGVFELEVHLPLDLDGFQLSGHFWLFLPFTVSSL